MLPGDAVLRPSRLRVTVVYPLSSRPGRARPTEASGLARCRSPLAVPGRGSGVQSAPLPPAETPRCREGPRRGFPDSWRRETSAQPRPEALRGKTRRLSCARTPTPCRGADWPHPPPRGRATSKPTWCGSATRRAPARAGTG
eukprot:scaffold24964_cov58-Phaeocystis_antarctica.AAC.1